MNRPFANATPVTETDKEKVKKQIEELKISAAMDRKPMSECIQDMLKYIQEHKDEDYLLHSTVENATNRGPNPLAEKKRCTLT